MNKSIKMMTLAQVLIMVGLIMAAVGGFIYYQLSTKDSDEKHSEIISKGSQTIDSLKNVEKSVISKIDTGTMYIKSRINETNKIIKKMDDNKKTGNQITITGDGNRVVGGDNYGINGDVHLDKPERKSDDQTIDYIVSLNKENKPFKIIYYTNTEECRKFGVEVINALKARGYEVSFLSRMAFQGINYPEGDANAAFEETESEFVIAFYPLR